MGDCSGLGFNWSVVLQPDRGIGSGHRKANRKRSETLAPEIIEGCAALLGAGEETVSLVGLVKLGLDAAITVRAVVYCWRNQMTIDSAVKLHRMAESGGIAVAACVIALGLGYLWVSSMHYPSTLRQRKMWRYYLLFLCALPVLGELHMALTFWVMPIQQSSSIAIGLLLAWMVVSFFMVRRMTATQEPER
jgi:hypothetical protein